jgi:hypothetical protein
MFQTGPILPVNQIPAHSNKPPQKYRTTSVTYAESELPQFNRKRALFVWLISHQAAVLFSQNKPATSTFLSKQTSISHQPPAKRTYVTSEISSHIVM